MNFCLFTRKNANNTDNYYYNNHFIVLHDLLRELAIYKCSEEPMEQRKRLIIEINQRGEKTEFLSWCGKQKPRQVTAHTLSISTGELYLF